jgi:hypothetical protein
MDEKEIEIEIEKLDFLQTVQIPCDVCGEVLCDGFCDDEQGREELLKDLI